MCFGYVGALCIIIGVSLNVLRKRWHRRERVGRLSTWLQVHIFPCTMAPFLVAASSWGLRFGVPLDV